MRVLRIAILVLAATALSGLLVACGGGEEESGASPTKTAARSPSATAAGGAQTTEVKAKDFSFDPAKFEATKGKPVTVKLTNAGAASHTLTVYTDEDYTTPVEGADTDTISPGAKGEFTVTFDKAADYYFRCEIHPTQMQGEIEVK